MKEYTPRKVKKNQSLIRMLYRRAQEASENAYAPYSQFCVGAALLACDSVLWTGVNVESASYGATVCAERTALVKAVSQGAREFAAIAIASRQGEAWPCGICRQMLYEFSPDMLVITGEDEEHLEVVTLSKLLPRGFRLQQ